MTSTEFQQAMARVADLKAEIKAHEEEIKDIFGAYAPMLSQPGNVPAGNYVVQVTPTVRFDAATAEQNLTPEEFDKIFDIVPSSATAKKVLPPERYALAQKQYGFTRTVVPVKE